MWFSAKHYKPHARCPLRVSFASPQAHISALATRSPRRRGRATQVVLSRPNALVVLRFKNNSTFVVSCTGRSLGLEPLNKGLT